MTIVHAGRRVNLQLRSHLVVDASEYMPYTRIDIDANIDSAPVTTD